MIAVLQRVESASVRIDGELYSEIGKGFLILLGVSAEDNEEDATLLALKISKMRIFEDSDEKMNLSVNDIGGAVMVVPNFTLLAGYKKGNRPDFIRSARPERANELFEFFCNYIEGLVPSVARGRFQADMKVSLVNDGPVTVSMDSRVLRGQREI
ncbi:MAG: D-tyrosyl-tRNA(Tyr) deacylase [Ruminococcaceae bacterium]|nr:D-tyrosyl-tRNA(Tyr) deacylase [Oscillospiraceae bacterium]